MFLLLSFYPIITILLQANCIAFGQQEVCNDRKKHCFEAPKGKNQLLNRYFAPNRMIVLKKHIVSKSGILLTFCKYKKRDFVSQYQATAPV